MAKSIMIIDDDPRVRDVYTSTLTSRGYDVMAMPDGESALDQISEKKPDLILLDVMMPKVFGIHVLDIIKSTPEVKDIKVIMLTALSDEETKKRAKEYGADNYIVKSETTTEEMLGIIDKVFTS